MNKLEELIQKLCPNGVTYKKLNTVCKIYDGTHSTPQYTSNGIKFVSVQNINSLYETDKYISEEDFKKFKITPQIGDVFMTRIGSIGACAVVEKDERLAYYVSLALLRPTVSFLNSRYLKYIIESAHGQKELRKRTLVNAVPIKINKDDIGKIQIPIPPLPIQHEIVHILDGFTYFSAKLQKKLTAELSTRRKQYEYYRDKLLIKNPKSKPMTLGDVGPVSMCKRIMKSETSPSGDIPFYKIGTFGKEADAFISRETFEKFKKAYSYPKKGDLLISAAGTIGRVVAFNGESSYFQDSNIVWINNDESKVLNTYLYYCYQLRPWKASAGGTISRLYNDNIRKTVIPVPSIPEQERIVAILDRFDTLCNDLTSSLLAEIQARQKQYEYYRDKLLSFKEASV